MGVHLDAIDAYTEETNRAIESLSSEFIIRALRNIFLVLLIGFLILYFIERNHLSNSTKFLEKQINFDLLTNAYSRRFGIKSLKTHFKQYPLEDEKAAIMMFDIDYNDAIKRIDDAMYKSKKKGKNKITIIL